MSKKRKKKAPVAFVEPTLPTYEVIKDFKYQGKMYRRGEEWKPLGGVWDRLIMSQKEFVLPVEDSTKIRAEKVKQANNRLEQMPRYAQ